MNPGYGHSPFDARNFFRERSVLNSMIILNIAVWAVIQILRVFLYLYNRETAGEDLHQVIDLLAVPAYLPTLLHQPWSLFTYMVLHENIWHILFNMLWLYWFGKIFLQYLSQRQLLLTYLLGGLAGGLVYIFAYNVFPVFRPVLEQSFALGASASVMAIVTAVSFHVPNYSIYLLLIGRVRIVYLAIALFVFDFFMIPTGNAGGHIAHIGGALFGFSWVMLFHPSSNQRSPAWKLSFRNLFGDLFKKRKRSAKGETGRGRPLSDDEYNRQRAENQRRIDEILEKISRGGYESLTREEKELLFKSSRKGS